MSDPIDRLPCSDVVCARGGHYACHDLPPPKPLRPRVHPLLEDIKRGAYQAKVAEMGGGFEGGPDSVEWLREQRGGDDE